MRFLVGVYDPSNRLQRLHESMALDGTGAKVVRVHRWDDVHRLVRNPRSKGLLLAGVEALLKIGMTRGADANFNPPAQWLVVAVWTTSPLEPRHIRQLRTWGVSAHYHHDELIAKPALRSLLEKAVLGEATARIRDKLLGCVEPSAHQLVDLILDATFDSLAVGKHSVASLARRLYRSRASLDRDFRRAGLASPGRFIRGVRMALAVLMRTDPITRNGTWRALGFPSPSALSNQVKTYFGHTLREFGEMEDPVILRFAIERLLSQAPILSDSDEF